MGVVNICDIFSDHFTCGGLKYRGPCWLYYVTVIGASSGYFRIELYDGTDANGELKTAIQGPADKQRHFKPCFPVYFSYGVYIEAVQNLSDGFFQVLPV